VSLNIRNLTCRVNFSKYRNHMLFSLSAVTLLIFALPWPQSHRLPVETANATVAGIKDGYESRAMRSQAKLKARTIATSSDSLRYLAQTPLTLDREAQPAWFTENAKTSLKAYFFQDGPTFLHSNSQQAWQFRIHPMRVAIGDQQLISSTPDNNSIKVSANKIEYQRGVMTEWYVNDHRGFEHGLTIKESKLFDQQKTLTAFVEFEGLEKSTQQLIDGQNLKFTSAANNAEVNYSQLLVTDANGKQLPSSFKLKKNTHNDADAAQKITQIAMVVDISNAQFPITIDPILTTKTWETGGSVLYGEVYGHKAINVGDVTGNGYDDALVSDKNAESQPSDVQTVNRGAVYLYEGSANGLSFSPIWSYTETQLDSAGTVGARYGYSLAAAGDINQDGFNDFIVGATTYSSTTVDHIGRVYVYLGTSGGVLATPFTIESETQPGSNFGTSVAAADVNGDGRKDLIIGHPEYDNLADAPNISQGRVLVFLAKPAAQFITTNPSTWFSATADWSYTVTGNAAGFATHVDNAGDVDNDGFEDIIVGSPGYSNGQNQEGAAYIFYGSAAGMSSRTPWRVESNQIQAWMGMRVAGVGDVNGDFIDDVMVSAIAWDTNAISEGKAFLYLGVTGAGPSTTESWSYLGGSDHANLNSVAAAGDVNGDGYGDVIIGLQAYSNPENLEGRILLFEGNANGLDANPVWGKESNVVSGQIGYSVGGGGDFNGDGFSDIIAGAPGINTVGAAYAFYGAKDSSDLEVLVTDSVDPVAPLTDYSYTISVSNYGPDPAKKVVLVDTLPSGAIFKSVSADVNWTCNAVSLTVTCNNNSILANAPSSTITIVTQYPTTALSVSNTATISSSSDDPIVDNNSNVETTQVNTLPIANDLTFSTNEDVTYNATQPSQLLPASDPDADPLSFSLGAVKPVNGSVIVQVDGAFTYVPNANYFGTDTFSYNVFDGIATVSANVSVTVNPVNDAPIANNAQQIVAEDTVLTGTLTASDIDTPISQLTYAVSQNPLQGNVTVNSSGSFTYTPAANFNGNDSFSFVVADNGVPNLTSVGSVSITVTPVNDPPVVNNQTFTTAEDTALSNHLVAIDDQTSTAQLTFLPIATAVPSKGSLNLLPDGSFTYTPRLNENGQDQFGFEVRDNSNPTLSSFATATIQISSVNDIPVALDGSLNIIENQKWGGFLLGIDADNDSLEYSLDTPPTKGTVEIYDTKVGGYTYTPNKDTVGADSFTFKVFDGTSYSDSTMPGKISVYINAAGSGNVNPSLPTLVAPAKGSDYIDPANATFLWQPSVDPDSKNLSYQIAVCLNDPTASCAPIGVNGQSATLSYTKVFAWSAPGAGLFLFSFMGGKRRKRWQQGILVTALAITLFACSNGAEEVEHTTPGYTPSSPKLLSYIMSNLQGGSSYYWKIIVSDNDGGSSVSEIRNFATKP